MKQRKQLIRYILLDTEGRVFDQLLKYIKYHSLSELLMELMQLSVTYEQSLVGTGSAIYGDVGRDGDDEGKQENAGPRMTGEQAAMHRVLEKKKQMVVTSLVRLLGFRNQDSLEDSLNAMYILIEMVEVDKTFELFMGNDAEIVGDLVELAVDPENEFNQQYLLSVLLSITKQLKSSAESSQSAFRDLDDDGQETKETNKNQQFDPKLPQNKNLLDFLDQVDQQNMLLNLLLIVNSSDRDYDGADTYYDNQQQHRVRKLGQRRLRALEVIYAFLQLLFPSQGKLAVAMVEFIKQAKRTGESSSDSEETDEKNNGRPEPGSAEDTNSPKHPISLARFLPTSTKRNLVRTLLFVLREYSYCSISNQLCIQILGQIMTMFDVVDVCMLQKFVINEFRARHKFNQELDETLRSASMADDTIDYKPVSRFKINHCNMQSAQVNQMTAQLKDRVELVQKYFKLKSRQEILEKTGVDVVYEDLISREEREFWASLCRKDFRRLEKLFSQNIGEGHFMDDSDELESEEEEQ